MWVSVKLGVPLLAFLVISDRPVRRHGARHPADGGSREIDKLLSPISYWLEDRRRPSGFFHPQPETAAETRFVIRRGSSYAETVRSTLCFAAPRGRSSASIFRIVQLIPKPTSNHLLRADCDPLPANLTDTRQRQIPCANGRPLSQGPRIAQIQRGHWNIPGTYGGVLGAQRTQGSPNTFVVVQQARMHPLM